MNNGPNPELKLLDIFPNEIIKMFLEHLPFVELFKKRSIARIFNFLVASIKPDMTGPKSAYQEIQHFLSVNMKSRSSLRYYNRSSPLSEYIITELERLNKLANSEEDSTLLEEQNNFLNNLNKEIILSKICTNSTSLDLTQMGLTRFSSTLLNFPELEEYWKNLKTVDFSQNMFDVLPNLSKLQALEKLECTNTQLTSIPDGLKELTKLIEVNFRYNPIPHFPKWFIQRFGDTFTSKSFPMPPEDGGSIGTWEAYCARKEQFDEVLGEERFRAEIFNSKKIKYENDKNEKEPRVKKVALTPLKDAQKVEKEKTENDNSTAVTPSLPDNSQSETQPFPCLML